MDNTKEYTMGNLAMQFQFDPIDHDEKFLVPRDPQYRNPFDAATARECRDLIEEVNTYVRNLDGHVETLMEDAESLQGRVNLRKCLDNICYSLEALADTLGHEWKIKVTSKLPHVNGRNQ